MTYYRMKTESFQAVKFTGNDKQTWPDWFLKATTKDLEEPGAICYHMGSYYITTKDKGLQKIEEGQYIVYNRSNKISIHDTIRFELLYEEVEE